MADGIYTADGRWMDFSDSSQMLDEVATRATRGEVFNWLGTLADPDPILRKLFQGDEVFDDLMSDDEVITATQGRKLGSLGMEYEFRAGALKDEEATDEANRTYTMLAQDLENIDIYNLIAQMLDTPFYGFVPVELLWKMENGYWRLKDLCPRPTSWFAFDDKNQPRFMTLDSGMNGKPLPKNKFVLVRHFPTYKNPYGLRLLSRCFWPVALKRGGRKFWGIFAERFGMPWVIGKYAKGTQYADKREMLSNLTNMVQDAVAIIPQGGGVELLSNNGSGGQVHQKLIEHMDAAISKVLQGQTLTSSVSKDGAAYSAGKVHASTLASYQAADRKLVKAAMEEIAWIYTKVNAAAGVISPSFHWPEDEAEEQEDTAGRDTRLTQQGVRFTKKYYMKQYNLEEDDLDVDTGSDRGSDGLMFADSKNKKFTPEQQAIEDLVTEAVGKASMKNIEQAVRKAVDESSDYEELMERLAALLPDLNNEDMQDVLERAAVISAGYGTTIEDERE
ncbi:MAG: DUF935 domain-containing protein [Deferribacterales bacterium]